MASYPIEIQSSSSDMSTLMTTMMGMKKKTEEHKDSKIYSRPYVEDVLESLSSSKKIIYRHLNRILKVVRVKNLERRRRQLSMIII